MITRCNHRPASCGRFLLLWCAALAAGCGSDRPETVPAGGTVTYNGKPVAEARVMFMAEGGRPASGVTDAEGCFELMTFAPGDGALPGEHVVTVSKRETVVNSNRPDDPYAPTRDLLPPRYAKPSESGLSAKVQADGENNFKFELSD